MSALLAIAANLILLAAAIGYGSLLSVLVPEGFSSLDRLALTLAGGLGITGTLLYGVGQFSFARYVILLILLPGLFLCWKQTPAVLRSCLADWKGARPPVLAVLIVAGVLGVTAVGGLAAPTGDMEHDAIAYHLLGPKVWLRDGIIRPVLDQSYTNFPAIVEASFGPLMALGGERGPEFFAVTGLIAILLMSAALAMRLGSGAAGAWWCAALIAAMPGVYHGSYAGFIDAVYGAFVLGAARIGFDAEKTSDFVLFGIFCGFAAATKYLGLIASALLIPCALGILIFHRRRDFRAILKGAAITAGVAAAVGCTVYVRNWILLGCPIYPPPPVLPRFFQVRYMPPSAIDWFQRFVLIHGRGMGRGFANFLWLPFNLTYHTANFNGAGGIGLAPLALAPFGIFALRRNAFGIALSLLAFFSTAAWFFTAQESRYLIPVYAISAAFAVLGWKYAAARAPRFGPALSGTVVAVSILYGLFMIGSARAEDLHAVLSPSYAERRAQEEIPFRESFNYLNGDPSVTKVLVMEPLFTAFYFDKDYVKPIGAVGEETVPEAGNLRAVLREAPGLQVSHILDVRWKGAPFRIEEDPPGLTLVFERADQRIYRVN